MTSVPVLFVVRFFRERAMLSAGRGTQQIIGGIIGWCWGELIVCCWYYWLVMGSIHWSLSWAVLVDGCMI